MKRWKRTMMKWARKSIEVEVLKPARRDLKAKDETVGKVLRIVVGGNRQSIPFVCRYVGDDVEKIADLLRDCVSYDNGLVYTDNESYRALKERNFLYENEHGVTLGFAAYLISVVGRKL